MITVKATAEKNVIATALRLRHAVFVVEQGVSLVEERDGKDEAATHFIAYEEATAIGTCRVRCVGTTVRLERLAVSQTARRRGVASKLLNTVEDWATKQHYAEVVLHAQVDALALYEKAGYQPVGQRFFEADIEHQKMQKKLEVT